MTQKNELCPKERVHLTVEHIEPEGEWEGILRNGVSLKINGEIYAVEVDLRETLLDVLRDRLGLTGTKRGCDMGECGTCTVLMDGKPVNACMLLAVTLTGRDILTIEGVTQNELHPIQQAFVKHGAVQCGFCTPGMILTAKAFLKGCPSPTSADVRRSISGNLCRCTGYRKIVDAVLDAASRMQKEA
jgi:carbon-monoxide dehydrogenase small subunit